MCTKTNEFRMPGIIYTVLYHTIMQHYITYSIPFDLQKTRAWSPTPSSRYTVDNSASGQRGGQTDKHEYCFICSKFLYTHYIHIYHPVTTMLGHPDTFWMPGGE